MIMVFMADYYKMDSATEPYLEAAVSLLVDYKGMPAWHCVTMPVTFDEARCGGIYYLGYPKIMGEIFSIRPQKIILAYYLKNKSIMRFEN